MQLEIRWRVIIGSAVISNHKIHHSAVVLKRNPNWNRRMFQNRVIIIHSKNEANFLSSLYREERQAQPPSHMTLSVMACHRFFAFECFLLSRGPR